MARYTPKLNLEEVGISQQDKLLSVQDWRTGLNGTSNSNMTKIDNFASTIDSKVDKEIQDRKDEVERIDGEVEDKITIDGEIANFKFIENQVSGELYSHDSYMSTTGADMYKYLRHSGDFTYLMRFNIQPNTLTTTNLYFMSIRDVDNNINYQVGMNRTTGASIFWGVTGGDYVQIPIGYDALDRENIAIIRRVNGVLSLEFNGLLLDKTFDVNSQIDRYGFSGTFTIAKNLDFYLDFVSTIDLVRNFSVLNNSPSIKELHTTDAEGKTSILPTLYKESKKARGTLIEIPYDEPRDLENYIYKFI